MKFPRPSFPEPRIRYLYTVSLFNVLLVVLVFVFFLPRWMGTSSLCIQLPRAVSGEPSSDEGHIVTILADDSIYLRDKRVSPEALRRIVGVQPKSGHPALIKADRRAHVATLVAVWDLLRSAGADRVYLATDE